MTFNAHRTEQLSATFLALSDPTRRAILERLKHGDASVSELAAPFALSQPTISKHLKVLEHAGLIERGRDAQRRPRRLAPGSLRDLSEWLETFRSAWESRFAQLDSHLAAMNDKEADGAP